MLPQTTCLITIRVEGSVISIDSNITDNIIRKVINVEQEKCRTKNGPLRNSNIYWIFLWKFPIQNHRKPPITEKIRNTASYLTQDLSLWRRTACQTLLKAWDISSATARVARDLLRALSILSDTTVKISIIDWEDLKP